MNFIHQSDSTLSIKQAMANLAVGHYQFEEAMDNLDDILTFKDVQPSAMILTGPAGSGKTTFGRKAKRRIEQALQVRDNAPKLPVLLVEAPDSSQDSKMVEELLLALGDPVAHKGTPTEKRKRVINYLKRLGVQLIIIDEVHGYLPVGKGTKTPKAIALLKSLMNQTKIPFLFMGTDEASKLTTDFEEMLGRTPNQVAFTPIKYGLKEVQKLHFANIVTQFANLLPTPVPALIFMNEEGGKVTVQHKEMLDRVYVATKGNLRSVCWWFQNLVPLVEEHGVPDASQYAKAWRKAFNTRLEGNPFEISARQVKKYLKEVLKSQ